MIVAEHDLNNSIGVWASDHVKSEARLTFLTMNPRRTLLTGVAVDRKAHAPVAGVASKSSLRALGIIVTMFIYVDTEPKWEHGEHVKPWTVRAHNHTHVVA